MKTSPVTPADLSASVLSVPPLARKADLRINPEANRALIRHLEAGSVRTLMYGGNANFYNIGAGEYAEIVDFLAEAAGKDTWVIPSVGPDYGKCMDQAAILRERKFPTAMVLPLPQGYPSTDAGAAKGIRRIAEAFGKPVIVYVKAEGYISPETTAALLNDGTACAVKYAIVRNDPKKDDFLAKLVTLTDRSKIISGIGERPAIVHLRDFGLKGFTSGSVCVAPRGSMRLLELLKAQRYDEAEKVRAAYIPLEDARDEYSPIRVLHEAVGLAGIADMGPTLPMLSNLDSQHHARVKEAATQLLAHDRALTAELAAA